MQTRRVEFACREGSVEHMSSGARGARSPRKAFRHMSTGARGAQSPSKVSERTSFGCHRAQSQKTPVFGSTSRISALHDSGALHVSPGHGLPARGRHQGASSPPRARKAFRHMSFRGPWGSVSEEGIEAHELRGPLGSVSYKAGFWEHFKFGARCSPRSLGRAPR